jgi:hypothetical protein
MANADTPRADQPAPSGGTASANVRDTTPWGDPAASAVDRQPGVVRVDGVATLAGVRRNLADDARAQQPSSRLPSGFGSVDGVPVLGARTQSRDRVEPVTQEPRARERGLFDGLPTGVPAVLGVRPPERDPGARDEPAARDREFDPEPGLLDDLEFPTTSPSVIGARLGYDLHAEPQGPHFETVDGVPTLTSRPWGRDRYAPEVTRGTGAGAADQEGGQ